MNTKTVAGRAPRRSSDVGLMMALALGGVFGPVIVFDIVALVQAALN